MTTQFEINQIFCSNSNKYGDYMLLELYNDIVK